MRTTADNRYEDRPGYAVLSGPVDQLDAIIAAVRARGLSVAPETDLRARASHGLPSHPSPAIADEAGAPNAGHTPGTPHPVTGRKYRADPDVTFVTVPLISRAGRDRPLDDVTAAIDASGWRLRMHTAPARHVVGADTESQQIVALRTELAALRRDMGLPPVAGGGAPQNPPYAMQTGSHPAELFRRAISTLIDGSGGSVGNGSNGALNISQNGSPNMSVNVDGGPGVGEVWVPGTTNPGQGLYYCFNDAPANLAISASDPTDPRVDSVIAQVEDAAYVGGSNLWQLAVVNGTPTPGATLGNLSGAGALPASSVRAGYVLVPAAATAIVTADLLYSIHQFGPSQGFGGALLQVPGAQTATLPSVLKTGVDNVNTIGAGATRFTYTVPGAIAFLSLCTQAWVGGYELFSDVGRTTEINPNNLSIRAAPNLNTVELTVTNFHGANVYPVIDVWAIGR